MAQADVLAGWLRHDGQNAVEVFTSPIHRHHRLRRTANCHPHFLMGWSSLAPATSISCARRGSAALVQIEESIMLLEPAQDGGPAGALGAAVAASAASICASMPSTHVFCQNTNVLCLIPSRGFRNFPGIRRPTFVKLSIRLQCRLPERRRVTVAAK